MNLVDALEFVIDLAAAKIEQDKAKTKTEILLEQLEAVEVLRSFQTEVEFIAPHIEQIKEFLNCL